MSGDSQPSGTSVVQSNNSPWSGVQPHLTTGLEKAEDTILNKPVQYYPNSTVVPFSPQTENALSMTENRAMTGSPIMNQAKTEVGNTLGGNYLNANPHLDQAVNAAARPVVQNFQDTIMPGIQSGFSKAGRYGSGMQAYQQRKAGEGLNRQLSDMAGSMAYQNYNSERDNMLKAGLLAPTFAQADYTDASQLERVGQVREAQGGAELQDQINRFMHDQTSERDALREYMTLVGGGSYGGQSTQSQPIYRNKVGEGLGMAATAAGIGGTLFGSNGIWPSAFGG